MPAIVKAAPISRRLIGGEFNLVGASRAMIANDLFRPRFRPLGPIWQASHAGIQVATRRLADQLHWLTPKAALWSKATAPSSPAPHGTTARTRDKGNQHHALGEGRSYVPEGSLVGPSQGPLSIIHAGKVSMNRSMLSMLP